jgi:predicted  nucleic acid-binding Zn-ribbon protein
VSVFWGTFPPNKRELIELTKIPLLLLLLYIERIDRYLSSDKEERLGKMNADLEQLSIDSKATEAELRLVRPELEELSTKVNNQLRHKKTITENITLIGRMKDLDKLERKVSELEEKSEAIEGSATCSEDHRNAAQRKKELVEKRARREGRKGGIIEQIRGLKVRFVLC